MFYHLYWGDGEPVEFDLDLLNETSSRYKTEAETLIYNALVALIEKKIFDKVQYSRPKRITDSGSESSVLGDYSIYGGFLLSKTSENLNICNYRATIYIEDEFNVKLRDNPTDSWQGGVRNLAAFFLNIPPNTSFLTLCEKTFHYKVDISKRIEDSLHI